MSGQKYRAARMEVIGYDCQLVDPENLFGPRHRIQRSQTGIIKGERGFGHADLDQRGLHFGRLVIAVAAIVPAQQETLDLADSKEIGGSFSARSEVRVEVSGVAAWSGPQHETDFIKRQSGRVGKDARSARLCNQEIAEERRQSN